MTRGGRHRHRRARRDRGADGNRTPATSAERYAAKERIRDQCAYVADDVAALVARIATVRRTSPRAANPPAVAPPPPPRLWGDDEDDNAVDTASNSALRVAPEIVRMAPWSEVLLASCHAKVLELYDRARASADGADDEIGARARDGVSPCEGRYLYHLICDNRLQRTLEIGGGVGVSALHCCHAHADSGNDGVHATIEPDARAATAIVDHVRDAGLAAHFSGVVRAISIVALPALLASDLAGAFDLVLVDGWHTFDYTLADVLCAALLLRVGGVLVLDDARHRGVADVVRYVDANYPHFERALSPATMVAYRKRGDDARAWNVHAPFVSVARRDRGDS